MNTEITVETLQNRLVGPPLFVWGKVDTTLFKSENDETGTSRIAFGVCPKCCVIHPHLQKV